MEDARPISLLDRPAASLLKLDWEKAAYLAILFAALASRFWNLGARAMSWDECSHGLFSYYLYSGSGYTHDPMMHGPFLYHANALVFFLLGDTDFTVRVVPALFGVFLVMSPLLLRRWLGRAGTLLASLLLLVSPSILFYSRYIRNDVYMAVWMVLLLSALLHFLESHRPRWFHLAAAVLMLSLATKENAYLFGFMGLVFLGQAVIWQRARRSDRPALYIGGAALSGLLLVGAALVVPGSGESQEGTALTKLADALLTVSGGVMAAGLVAGRLIPSRHPGQSDVIAGLKALKHRDWLLALAVMLVIYSLLFTAFFSNPAGLISGIWGSVSYWFGQQEIQRGYQPWYYYGLLLVMYEFLPLLLGSAGGIYYLVRGPRRSRLEGSDAEAEGGHATDRPAPDPGRSTEPLFVAFLIFWTVASLFMYGWAGEKMPWMVVHQVLPLILLAAKFAGQLAGGLVRREGMAGPRWNARRPALLAAATMLALLGGLTVRTAWQAAYANADYATELLVYAHGGADVKPLMAEIAEISRRTAGGKQTVVAYDQEAAWPLEWYLREYPNRRYYGSQPTREALDAPLVIASDEIDRRVRPFLGRRYFRFQRREIWWPNQQYMDLTWPQVRQILGSAEQREKLWRILWQREYPRTPDDWYNVSYVYFYVRKDVAAQVWALAPASALETSEGDAF